MRQPATRVICGAIAWIVLVAAAIFLFRSENDIEAMRAAVRVFDLQARETTDALAELRAAQQAYVVGGQGVAFWVAKVVTTGDAVRASVETLNKSATALVTRAALENAVTALGQFASADKRALEYINAGQPLMAGDVIFAEGSQAAATAAQQVEGARLAERQEADAREAAIRRYETIAAGGTAVLVAVLVMLLVPGGSQPRSIVEARPVQAPRPDARPQPYAWVEDGDESVEYARRIRIEAAASSGNGAAPIAESLVALQHVGVRSAADDETPAPVDVDSAASLRLNVGEPQPAKSQALASRNGNSEIRLMLETTPDSRPDVQAAPGFLRAAADLATDFGRVHDLGDLKHLIGRAATLTDASGVVVWLGNAQGGDLRPVLTYGYSAHVVARLTPVPRSANNAAAAAYRSGTLQVVPSQPFSSGAIVAPILGPDGCIGALSAEFRGAEASEPVQAFAAILAAQLAGVLTPSSDAAESRMVG